MRPSRRLPYPYDVTLEHEEVGTAGLILAETSSGKVIRHRHKGLDQVTPTDYAYGSQSPFRARQSVFKRLVMGYGQPVQEEESSQRYDHAIGMDWSCGLGVLPTAWNGPFTLPPGPIKDLATMRIGSVRHLYVLSGDKLYDSSAASITGAGDFTLLRDFAAIPAAPPAPTAVVPVPGTTDYRYKVASSIGWGVGLATILASPASPELHLTNGPSALSVGTPINLSFTPPTGGLDAYLYRSLDGGATWVSINMGHGISTYVDDGSGVFNPATPPTAGVNLLTPTYQLYSGFYTGPLLFVGTDNGPFWMWDGAQWILAALDGRCLVQQGYHTYRSSHYTFTGDRSNINAAYNTTIDPKFGLGSGSAPNWKVLYQSGGQTPITRIAPMGGTMLVCEEGRIGIGGSGDTGNTAIASEITPERTSEPSPDNGRCGTVWQGSFYTPYGAGFYKITPTSTTTANVESIGPERLIENTSPVKGRVTACVGWGPWHLFYVLYDGTTSYLCKWGAWVNPEAAHDPQSQLLPVPHGALETWPARVNWLAISEVGEPLGNPRLWAGFQDGSLRWTLLPRQSPFAPTDVNCRFRPTGYTMLSRHTLGFQLDDKRYQHLTAFGPTISPTLRVRYYYVLPDGTEHELAGLVTENGAPLDFPLNVEGKWIQIKVVLETSDPTDSPVVEGIALEEQLNPSSVEEISLTAHVNPHLILRHSHPTRRSAASLVQLLRRLEARGDDVLLTLPDGSQQRVAIIDLADHYLAGASYQGDRHDVGLTLITFKTNTPTELWPWR